MSTKARRLNKETVGYRGAHWRITRERGPAIEFDCVCGDHAAREWALMKEATDLLYEDGKAYSLNVEDYQPMSRSCHKKYDNIRPPRRGGLNG